MSRRKCFLKYTLLFLVVFAGAFLAFFIQGKSFVWKSDGFRQYYPALRYLISYYRELVSGLFSGEFAVPMMDYTIGQGEDIITTFANYGLGDPLVFLASLLPSGGQWTEYVYGILTGLRLYLSGAAFLFYCEGMKLQHRYSVYGALAYCFCGFALWSVKDPFFLNAMIYLPLVFLGLEKVLRRRSPLLLIFSVFFSIVSGYYFFYMTVIAGVCYFAARSFMRHGRDIKEVWKDGLRCLMVSAGGVLLSGVLFMPCIFGYLESSRGEANVPFSSLLFYPLDYYKNMFLHLISVTENDDAGAVGYFSMAVILLLACGLLLLRREKKYRTLKVCVILSILAVASPFVGYVFNGFGYITNRFMFIPAFLLSLVLVLLLPSLLCLERRDKKKLILVCGCYVILCCLLTSREGIWHTGSMILFLGLTLAALCLIRQKRWRERALWGLLLLNLMVNGNLMYGTMGTGMSDAYMDAGSVKKAYESEGVKAVSEDLDSLERIDVMTDQGENPNRSVAGVPQAYNGISVYYSVISSGYSAYMKSMENAADLMYTHRMLGNDGRSILENLANVHYVVSRNASSVPYGFSLYRDCGKGEKVYKNDNRTSIGYTYDTYVPENEFDSAGVFDRQNILLTAAVLEGGSRLERETSESETVKKGQIYKEWASLPFEMSGVKHMKWQSGKLKVKKKNGTFSISFQRKKDCEYYLRLSGLELQDPRRNTAWANISLGDMSKSFLISDRTYDFYFGRKDYVVNLGSPSEEQAGRTETVSFRINGPAAYRLENIELVEVPMEGLAQKVAERNQESLRGVEVTTNGLTGSLKLYREKILCLAVPYKTGYTLLVDGRKTETGRINKMYLGALIPEGTHDIVLRYATPGIRAGAILTIMGLIYTIFLCILYKKYCTK